MAYHKCPKCDFKYHCGGDCRGSAYINSGRDLTAPVQYCSARIDSLIEIFDILSEDPFFMANKANAYVNNALEERDAKRK